MTDAELEARVRAVIREVSKRQVEPLGPDDDLVERLALDSLEGLKVLAALEKRVGIRFRDEQLAELRSVRRIVEAIRAAASDGGEA